MDISLQISFCFDSNERRCKKEKCIKDLLPTDSNQGTSLVPTNGEVQNLNDNIQA